MQAENTDKAQLKDPFHDIREECIARWAKCSGESIETIKGLVSSNAITIRVESKGRFSRFGDILQSLPRFQMIQENKKENSVRIYDSRLCRFLKKEELPIGYTSCDIMKCTT